jgi:Uma2 family endonuclease
MTNLTKPLEWSAQTYLEHEDGARERSELIDGTLRAMSGGKRKHNTILRNIGRALDPAALERGCEIYTENVKVEVKQGESYYYPDIAITCTPPGDNPYFVYEPCTLFEISSPSTVIDDYNDKKPRYMGLASVKQIFLVSSDKKQLECYTREASGWHYDLLLETGQIEVSCIGAILTLEQVYARVNLSE